MTLRCGDRCSRLLCQDGALLAIDASCHYAVVTLRTSSCCRAVLPLGRVSQRTLVAGWPYQSVRPRMPPPWVLWATDWQAYEAWNDIYQFDAGI